MTRITTPKPPSSLRRLASCRERLWAWSLLLLVTSGCTTRKHTFPGQDATNVWTALVAVAQAPDYDDPDVKKRWAVQENEVWIDPDEQRLEIYRHLIRRVYRPGKELKREDQSWRFRVTLGVDEEDHVPIATFTSRGLAVPAHALAEADKYFADVADLLSGVAADTRSAGSRAPLPEETSMPPVAPADPFLPPLPEPQPPQTPEPIGSDILDTFGDG